MKRLLVLLLVASSVAGAAGICLGGEIHLTRDEKGIIHISNVGTADPSCLTAGVTPWDDAIHEQSTAANLDPVLVREVIRVESNFNPWAISSKGARGLMQLMPGTARRYGISDPYDPVENIKGGTLYLRDLLSRYDGNLEKALAAYNAGEGAVDRYGTIPPYRETKGYVKKVLTNYTPSPKELKARIYRVESALGETVMTNRPELYPGWKKTILR